MRIRALAVALALLACSATGFASTQMPQTALRPTASAYVEKAAMADLFEIRSSQVVLDKLQHLDVRQFARTMIDHHQHSTEFLKESVRQANMAAPMPPPMLDRVHAQMLEELKAAPPPIVDRVYLDIQMKAHEEALRLHQYYAARGTDATLRQAAAERVQLVQRHLTELERMARNLVASAAK